MELNSRISKSLDLNMREEPLTKKLRIVEDYDTTTTSEESDLVSKQESEYIKRKYNIQRKAEKETYKAAIGIYSHDPMYFLGKAEKGKIGYPLASTADVTIHAHSRAEVNFGFKVVLPRGTYGRIDILPKLAKEAGLFVAGGGIEHDHKQELGVVVFNHSNQDYTIMAGENAAYLTIVQAFEPMLWILMTEPSAGNAEECEAIGQAMLKVEEDE